MGQYEQRPVVVTLTVEVDGHVLTFRGDGVAKGSFLHGQPYQWSPDVMEAEIQGVTDTLIAKVTKDAGRFLARAFPVAGHADGQPSEGQRTT